MSKQIGVSGNGAPIYSYEGKELEFQPPELGDELTVQSIETHYAKYLGQESTVFHEILSSTIHVDVHFFEPTSDRPFNVLCTTGMSSLPMTVPNGYEQYRYAELMVALPPSWQLDGESLKDENNYWPIRTLKMLARFPHDYNTWLGNSHTVANGSSGGPYAPNTRFCGVILLPPTRVDPDFHQLKISEDKVINFLCLVPLYQEELRYARKRGSDALIDRIDAAGITELIDTSRKSVCKRSFWQFW